MNKEILEAKIREAQTTADAANQLASTLKGGKRQEQIDVYNFYSGMSAAYSKVLFFDYTL